MVIDATKWVDIAGQLCSKSGAIGLFPTPSGLHIAGVGQDQERLHWNRMKQTFGAISVAKKLEWDPGKTGIRNQGTGKRQRSDRKSQHRCWICIKGLSSCACSGSSGCSTSLLLKLRSPRPRTIPTSYYGTKSSNALIRPDPSAYVCVHGLSASIRMKGVQGRRRSKPPRMPSRSVFLCPWNTSWDSFVRA